MGERRHGPYIGRKLQRAGIILNRPDDAIGPNSDRPYRAVSWQAVNGLYANMPLTGFPWADPLPFGQVKRAGLFTGMGLY